MRSECPAEGNWEEMRADDVGRLVQELRGEDKKFQPMAEAKRRCIWGADSSETKLK